ncbi:XRE family transcriptional regulator [Moraxella nasibovis]|uniref:LexA family protein n=1 Tax=Moraxella nasibovis TaxID=2904120 RepID=UPI00240F036F|nr:XRE family transcriptional regulator [Moraxella nasibovis]WFF39264.1 XRE family transcriptional regulator [Moraxella nasibovis]
MSLSDRLKSARKAKKFSQAEVAERIDGLSQSAYSQLESGKSKTTTKMIELARLFGVNADWLATGQGEMSTKPSIDDLRQKMNEIQGRENGVEHANPVKMLPIINEVQAGHFTEIGDDVFDEYEPAHHKDGDYWLRVKGDSMTPDFNQGDLILIGRNRVAVTGNYVVALVADDPKATFKKYRECFDGDKPYHQLIALNEFYPTIDSRAKAFEVIGVVLEHKRVLV